MSNNDLMLGMSDRTRLRAHVTYLMLKGAGYAALVFFSGWILVAALGWFGRTVLPEDAQLAADPAPQAFIDMAERARAAEAPAAEAPAAEAPAAEAPAADAAATDADAAAMEAAPAADDAAADAAAAPEETAPATATGDAAASE
jgi:hypothetical protein